MNRLALLAATCAATALTSVHAADLQVTVAGGAEKGAVYLALYDRASFLGKPIATAQAPAGQRLASFRGLAPGSYAVSVFQDLNDNGVLDRNLVGAPLEPFGFSNDAMGNFAPPTFDAAALEIAGDNRSITITLR